MFKYQMNEIVEVIKPDDCLNLDKKCEIVFRHCSQNGSNVSYHYYVKFQDGRMERHEENNLKLP